MSPHIIVMLRAFLIAVSFILGLTAAEKTNDRNTRLIAFAVVCLAASFIVPAIPLFLAK